MSGVTSPRHPLVAQRGGGPNYGSPRAADNRSGQGSDHKIITGCATSGLSGPNWTTLGTETEPWPEQVFFTFDIQPVPGKQYFTIPDGRPIDVGVCIPCYNEEGYDLERSLGDLEENFRNAEVATAHIVVVLDGIEKISDSMKSTLINKLGFRIGMTAVTTRSDVNVDKTYFVQRDHTHSSTIMADKCFQITCVVKGTNRKKHNSQEWFLRGFCPGVNPKLAFLVDCGTCFDPYCVLYLKHCLDHEPGVIAVSGRARVMNVSRQSPDVAEGNCLCMREDQTSCLCCFRACLRNVQRYEMEATHSVDKPLFSAIGFLPVLPGPCVMMRYQNDDPEVQRNLLQAFDWFFDFVHQTPEVAQLIGANLILAEDRILSYAVPISTGLKTKWVHQALFYFDAETEAEVLARQRRRWNSGTIAGHIWLFNNIMRSKIAVNRVDKSLSPLTNRLPQSRKCCLKALITVEIFKIVFNALSPTVFLLGVYYGLQVIINQVSTYDPALAPSSTVNEFIAVVIPLVILVFLMLFVIRHSALKCGKFTGKVYDATFFLCIMVLGVFMSAGAIYAIYETVETKIVSWGNEISVGFTFNQSDMTDIDVDSRDFLDGIGHYMKLSELILPDGVTIEPTHPIDGKYTPFSEVFEQYQALSHSILSGKVPVTMLVFVSNAFSDLNHPQTQTLKNDMDYIDQYGWEHVYPFCNSVLSNTSNCTTTNTMASLMAAWTAPQLIKKIDTLCPDALVQSANPNYEWHVECQAENFQFYLGVVITTLMFVVLFLPLTTYVLILEIIPVLWMVLGFIPYYLYLPTMVGAYGTYAVAQMNNLSWGNRQNKADDDADESGTAAMKGCVNKLVIAVIAGNVAFTLFAVVVPDDSMLFLGVFVLINLPAIFEAMISLGVLVFHYWCCCRRFRCCCRRGCCYRRNQTSMDTRPRAKSFAAPRATTYLPETLLPPDAKFIRRQSSKSLHV